MSRIENTGNGGTANLNEAAQKVSENLRDLGGQVREAAQEKYERVSGQARDYFEHGREAAQQWENELESYVHEKPVQAVLIAAGVGLLVGLLWGRH